MWPREQGAPPGPGASPPSKRRQPIKQRARVAGGLRGFFFARSHPGVRCPTTWHGAYAYLRAGFIATCSCIRAGYGSRRSSTTDFAALPARTARRFYSRPGNDLSRFPLIVETLADLGRLCNRPAATLAVRFQVAQASEAVAGLATDRAPLAARLLTLADHPGLDLVVVFIREGDGAGGGHSGPGLVMEMPRLHKLSPQPRSKRGADDGVPQSGGNPRVRSHVLRRVRPFVLTASFVEEAHMAKKRKRKYSRGAGTEVKREMHRYKRGKRKAARVEGAAR
jgi:hypothetical protein